MPNAKPPDENPFPVDRLDLYQMNRILRHRLRNLAAGVGMAVYRFSEETAATHPHLGDTCTIIHQELKNMQRFTERMDLLFDPLPDPLPKTYEVIALEAKEQFDKSFPYCHLTFEGDLPATVIPNGSWLEIVMLELLQNAGEAAGIDGEVIVTGFDGVSSEIEIRNGGEDIPEEIPTAPPQPFYTTRGKHDGLGLTIAQRVCDALAARLEVVRDNGAGEVLVRIGLPKP